MKLPTNLSESFAALWGSDSAEKAIEAGASRRPAGPGKGPAALPPRSSSGSSAPQATSLLAVPPEVRQGIFNLLPVRSSQNLLAVHNTCTALRRDVVADGNLQRRHQVAQQMAHLAMLASKAVGRATQPDRAAQCVPLLPLLNPKQRGKLVDVVVNEHNYGGFANVNHGRPIDGAGLRAERVGDMVAGLAYLDEAQQSRLVQAALGFAGGNHAAKVICSFGTELAHLSQALHGELVGKALGLANEANRAVAIAGLGAGLAHLNQEQQQDLLTAALGMNSNWNREAPLQNWKREAIFGLCKGLKHLDADQRDTLFNEAITVNADQLWLLALAIENLGSSLGCLSDTQRSTLVDFTTLMMEGRHSMAPRALRGLAAGLQQLTENQRDRLVTATTQIDPRLMAGCDAIAALGAGLAHLTPMQQDRLLDAASRLPVDKRGSIAVAGLAAGLGSLNTVQKDRVVRMACMHPNNDSKAKAIAVLGARLGDLEHAQHEALVDAAKSLFMAGTVNDEMSRTLGAGLGVGLGSLHPDLRSALVNALTRQLTPEEGPLRASTAWVIAGLGAGRPHLDKAQYKELVAAATRHHGDSVIVAFAGEAIKALDPGGVSRVVVGNNRHDLRG